jgi:hypothetical protein
LPAIVGYVPDQMVQAIAAFMDFCYLVRQSSLNEADLAAIDEAAIRFKRDCVVFTDLGVYTGDEISIPRIHAMQHYRQLIEDYGAPNGLCSSITESKHIRAVKIPWRTSNKNNALSQMLLSNQCLNKLIQFRAAHLANGLLDAPLLPEDAESYVMPVEMSGEGGEGYRDDQTLDEVDESEARPQAIVGLSTPSMFHSI